jgi:hypothetical protein
MMSRNPPDDVKKKLREEVGFCCPVPECGKPYLEWHHFNPQWHIEEHHRPEGMIALCREHHIQADHGAFTVTQLQKLKTDGKRNWALVKGRFNWMRNRILAVVGGNFYYETMTIFQFGEKPIIWLERDSHGYLLLNVNMLTNSGQPRACIQNNVWANTGGEEDIECPPCGKRIHICYPNGDMIKVEFVEINSLEDAKNRYSDAPVDSWKIEFPITAIEVANVVAGTDLEFTARGTKVGASFIKNFFASHCDVGLKI